MNHFTMNNLLSKSAFFLCSVFLQQILCFEVFTHHRLTLQMSACVPTVKKEMQQRFQTYPSDKAIVHQL